MSSGGEDKGLMDVIHVGNYNSSQRLVLGDIKPNRKVVLGNELLLLEKITGVVGQQGSSVKLQGVTRTGGLLEKYETTDGKIWYRYGDFSGGDIVQMYCYLSPSQQIGDSVLYSIFLGATISSDGTYIIESTHYGNSNFTIQKKEVVGTFFYRK